MSDKFDHVMVGEHRWDILEHREEPHFDGSLYRLKCGDKEIEIRIQGHEMAQVHDIFILRRAIAREVRKVVK